MNRDEVATALNGAMLSVVLPCYKIGAALQANLRAVSTALEGLCFELVPVDDGSCDETAEAILRSVQELGSDRVRPVLLTENGGKGAALKAGFAHSRGEYVLLLDGDLDLDPARTWDFLSRMFEGGADIVIGSKMHRESVINYPLRRRLASLGYYSLVKLLIGLPVRDTQTGMKLFRRDALAYALARMLCKRFAFDLELLTVAHGAGYKIAEAPVELEFGPGKMGCLSARTVCDVLTDTLAIFYRVRVLDYYRKLELRPMPEPSPLVSAVIACPGDSPMLRECIASLKALAYPSLEIIVLPDVAFDLADPAVRVLPTGKVLPSDKRNIGIRAARGSIIALIDDDVRVRPWWIDKALPYFSDPVIVAVGGPSVTARGDSLAQYLSGRVYASVMVSGAYRRRYTPTCVCTEDDLPSCNLLVRKEALERVGLFDSRYWPGEDTILCMRLTRELGGRMVYDPGVEVEHHRRPLFGAHLRQVGRYASHRGYFARKFPSTSRRLAYMVPSMLLVGTIGALALAPALFVAGAPCAVRMLAWTGLGILAFYLATAAVLSWAWRLRVWIGTFAGIVCTHYVYGAQFLRGLFARSLPGGVRGFDHQGEVRGE